MFGRLRTSLWFFFRLNVSKLNGRILSLLSYIITLKAWQFMLAVAINVITSYIDDIIFISKTR